MKEVLQTGIPDLDFRSGEAEGLVPGDPKISGAEEGMPYIMTKEEFDKYIEEKRPEWIKEIKELAEEDRRVTEEVKRTLRKLRTRDPKLVQPCSY